MYHNLRAAQGYLELGDPDSAWEELESIPAEDRAHPVAFRLRVYIYRDKGKWMEMAEISRHLTEVEPDQPETEMDKPTPTTYNQNNLQGLTRTLVPNPESAHLNHIPWKTKYI